MNHGNLNNHRRKIIFEGDLMSKLKRMSPGMVICLGFAAVILLGTILLYLPITHREGIDVSFIDALFTATSAVCVTGLVAIDIADNFNFIGQLVVAILIQTGGLGFASIGVGFILLARKKVNFRERLILKESLNVDSLKGIVRLVKTVLTTALIFESIGAVLSFMTFSKVYPLPQAIWVSIFHAISAFNNCGYDILGGFQNLMPYKSDLLLNLTTTGLIIFGGLGFYVIEDIIHKKSLKKLSLHSKIVITMTVSLLVLGTVMIKLSQGEISWLGAYFTSTVARTAGFSTFNLGEFSNPALFVVIILMFIGASPGSTGGGIKTTTTFIIFNGAQSLMANRSTTAFKRRISTESISKAFTIFLLAISIAAVNTLALTMINPQISFIEILFEIVSALGTVGLSTGITPQLNSLSQLIVILTMYIGRVGALTLLSLWSLRQSTEKVTYSEEQISLG